MIRVSYIYKITSPTGRIYVGRTVNPETRQCQYRNSNCRKQRLVYNSIKKYGWDKHKFEIIYKTVCDSEFLDNLEIFFIKEYNSFNGDNVKYGLNLTRGGKTPKGILKGKPVSKDTREKISKTLMGHNWHPISDKGRKSISEKSKSRNSVGNLQKPEIIEKARKASKMKLQKPIFQFDKDLNLIKEWDCMADAAKAHNVSETGISRNARGGRKSCAGFIWKYKIDL